MLLGLLSRSEGAKVLPLACLRIGMPGIDPKLSRLQFANHRGSPYSR